MSQVTHINPLPEVLEMPSDPTLVGEAPDKEMVLFYIDEPSKVINEQHLSNNGDDTFKVDWQMWYKTGFGGIYDTYAELRDAFNRIPPPSNRKEK